MELLGFLIIVCGIALWLIHDLHVIATVMMAIGGLLVIAGMYAEKRFVGYHED
jgi:hypothetical protein